MLWISGVTRGGGAGDRRQSIYPAANKAFLPGEKREQIIKGTKADVIVRGISTHKK